MKNGPQSWTWFFSSGSLTDNEWGSYLSSATSRSAKYTSSMRDVIILYSLTRTKYFMDGDNVLSFTAATTCLIFSSSVVHHHAAYLVLFSKTRFPVFSLFMTSRLPLSIRCRKIWLVKFRGVKILVLESTNRSPAQSRITLDGLPEYIVRPGAACDAHCRKYAEDYECCKK